jgi:hypothetical protein
MDAVRTFPALFLLLGAWLCSAPAQVPPAAKTPPVFSLLNLIRAPQPATLKIGSEPVGEGQMSLGFYTGIVTWLPSVPLLVEAPGFGALRIPFTPAVGGECPLFVVQDALEKPPGGGEPKPVLKFISIANAKDRPASFTDGLNLTSREILTGNLGGKPVSLEKGKRTRISTANGFVLQMKDSPEVAVSPSEAPGHLLVIFYENLDGKIEFAVTNDTLINP